MSTPFGPQLIGETEKTLNAILRCALDGTELSEAHWVTLRLAGQLDSADRDTLAAGVADRAHLGDSARVVDQLAERGLLEGGRLSADGRALVAGVQARIASRASAVWEGLPIDEVAATERLLNEVVRRGRLALAAEPAR